MINTDTLSHITADQPIRFRHKDAYRFWWEITAWPLREEPAAHDPEMIDHWWAYRLTRESDLYGKSANQLTGEVLCQYDLLPTAKSIMEDIAHQMVSLAMSFAAQCRAGESI